MKGKIMKKIGKLLLVILCALLLVTGCGKKEDKAKITLTKSQIKNRKLQ